MQPDAIRFKLAAHADVIVSHRGVTSIGGATLTDESGGRTSGAPPSDRCWRNSWMHRRRHGARPMELLILLPFSHGRTGSGCGGWLSIVER
jgi:hypothetical protein